MIVSVIALLAAGVAASDAPPPPGAPPPKPAVVAKTSDLDKQNQIICHTMIPTGSRLGGVRECHTKAQWDEEAREAQQATENQQAQGINNGGK